jgi:hypothetical protein
MRAMRRVGWRAVAAGLLLTAGMPAGTEEPTPAAVSAFNASVSAFEARLAQQHRSRDGFLVQEDWAGLRRGELRIERVTPASAELPGALEHAWRGSAFVAGATTADFERVMRDLGAYPRWFPPQVLAGKVLGRTGYDHFLGQMRVRQKHVVTVVLDTIYDVTYGRLDAQHGYSLSRSTEMREIADAGTPSEHALSAKDEHGYLWRLNSYWSYAEGDGGLYVQIESISMTRSIPTGLGWLIGPFVQSVPRESLEFTLQSVCKALKK